MGSSCAAAAIGTKITQSGCIEGLENSHFCTYVKHFVSKQLSPRLVLQRPFKSFNKIVCPYMGSRVGA